MAMAPRPMGMVGIAGVAAGATACWGAVVAGAAIAIPRPIGIPDMAAIPLPIGMAPLSAIPRPAK